MVGKERRRHRKAWKERGHEGQLEMRRQKRVRAATGDGEEEMGRAKKGSKNMGGKGRA